MIRYSSISGKQTITEVCDKCQCHIKDLSIWDITLKKEDSYRKKMTKDGKALDEGKADGPRPKCYCEHCKHD